MMVLATKTPVILHYGLFLVIPLLLVFVRPFYDALKAKEVYFHYYVTAMVILLLELTQILALNSIQRIG
jgi:hypothetical protein